MVRGVDELVGARPGPPSDRLEGELGVEERAGSSQGRPGPVQLARWCPRDRSPSSCRFDQLEIPADHDPERALSG